MKMKWRVAILVCCFVCSVSTEEEVEGPYLKIMARSTVYNAGETKALFCKAKHIAEPVEWYSPANKKIEYRSKNNRIYVEKQTAPLEDELLVPLIIYQIKISDTGNWTCKAGDFSDSIDIIVGEKAVISDRNVSMEGHEGKSVRFTCDVKGHPTPVVVWYSGNAKPLYNDSTKYHIRQDNSLEIKKLDHTDVGTYICKVRQKALSYYTDKTVHLSVQHKPIIYNSYQVPYYSTKFKTEEVYAILNETKNISCFAIANPPPTYRWSRRENGFDNDAHPIVDPETVITSEDGTSSVLILRMHDESYLGEYKCSASNSKGQESIIFHVTLGTKPNPPDFISFVSANASEIVFNVSCSTCNYQTEENVVPNPENLTIIGYTFELVREQKNYPPDWEAAIKFDVDIKDSKDTLFAVGPLTNSTQYHVRVQSRNAAGSSDWLEFTQTVATTDHAIRMASTFLLVIVAYVFTRFH